METVDNENVTGIPIEIQQIPEAPSQYCYSTRTIDLLSKSVTDLCKPNLLQAQNQLNELTTKQMVLIEQLHNENMKLSWSQNSKELQDMIIIIKEYQHKLLNIKKQMRSLHERNAKVMKRGSRLQQHQDKEMYIKNQQVKQEQDLVAKPNSSNS